MTASDRLGALGITLPAVTPPVAAFVPWVRAGDLLFLSGHIARAGGEVVAGRLGDTLTTAAGTAPARSVAIDLLGTLQAAAGGDLARVRRIVKLMVLVNSAPDFTEQHLVANGASELIESVFGDRGAHARSAFGVAQVPFGACVEIEMIAELEGEP